MTQGPVEMRTVNQLIEFIRGKSDDTTSVLLKSDTFNLDIPIGDKDVMCMKVIRLIDNEFGEHTMGEAIEMLIDTIWWMQTTMIAFPETGLKKEKQLKAVSENVKN